MGLDTNLAPVGGPRWKQQNWMADAVCKGQTHHFFAPAGEREERRLVREAIARRICAECPVLLECRDYARRNGELGFWGGENDDERMAFRRRARTIGQRRPLAS